MMNTRIQISEDDFRKKNEKRERMSRNPEVLLAARGELS